ncbi:MAG: DNA recombination protein RmuC [Gammaproteobacteria bacterium]|nr:DNA recombination protein RmuC [Gammaproteobacteria bacterium]
MTDIFFFIALIFVAAIAAVLGWLIGHHRSQRHLIETAKRNAELATTLELERQATQDKLATIEKAKEQLMQNFSAASAQAMKSNSEEFLRLAKENLGQFQILAQADLEKKEKAIEGMLTPIKDALKKTEEQVRHIENERKEAYGSITKHLETMTHTQQVLHQETRNLVQALRRPEVRGQWGEMTLKRLAELAGMVEHCDFYEQEHTPTTEGAIRPDMIVRMPGGREIVVDAKTPLDAYLSAIEAPEDVRSWHLERHARKVRDRVRELAARSYWSQFKRSPDFVVMFIPGDQFLSAALDIDRNLLEDALRQKVILATPTSFVALLRAVAYGWQQQVLAENAEQVRDLGVDLYKRLSVFTGHLARLGKHLGNSLDHYNKAVGSFERQVIPGARKFTEMGISAPKPIEELEQIEKGVRSIEEDTSAGFSYSDAGSGEKH